MDREGALAPEAKLRSASRGAAALESYVGTRTEKCQEESRDAEPAPFPNRPPSEGRSLGRFYGLS